MTTPPPLPIRATRSPSAVEARTDPFRPLSSVAAGGSVGTPVGPVIVLAIGVLASAILLALSWFAGAGSTDDVSVVAVVGWLAGGVASLLVFAWFRSVDGGLQADPNYVEPSWRPRRAATMLATTGWLISVLCGVLVAASWARR